MTMPPEAVSFPTGHGDRAYGNKQALAEQIEPVDSNGDTQRSNFAHACEATDRTNAFLSDKHVLCQGWADIWSGLRWKPHFLALWQTHTDKAQQKEPACFLSHGQTPNLSDGGKHIPLDAFECKDGTSAKKLALVLYWATMHLRFQTIDDQQRWKTAFEVIKYGSGVAIAYGAGKSAMDMGSEIVVAASKGEDNDEQGREDKTDTRPELSTGWSELCDEDGFQAVASFDGLWDITQGSSWSVSVVHNASKNSTLDVVFKSAIDANYNRNLPVSQFHSLVRHARTLLAAAAANDMPRLPSKSGFIITFASPSTLQARNKQYTRVLEQLVLHLGVPVTLDLFFHQQSREAEKGLLVSTKKAELSALESSIHKKEDVFEACLALLFEAVRIGQLENVQANVARMFHAFLEADKCHARIQALRLQGDDTQLQRIQKVLVQHLGDDANGVMSRTVPFPAAKIAESPGKTPSSSPSDPKPPATSLVHVYDSFIATKTRILQEAARSAEQRLDYAMKADDMVLALATDHSVTVPAGIDTGVHVTKQWRNKLRALADLLNWEIAGLVLRFKKMVVDLEAVCEARNYLDSDRINAAREAVAEAAEILLKGRTDLLDTQIELCNDKISEAKSTIASSSAPSQAKEKARLSLRKWDKRLSQCYCNFNEKKAQVSRDLDSCDKSVQAWLKRTRTQRQRHQRATKQSIGLDESKGSRLAALKRIMQTAARGNNRDDVHKSTSSLPSTDIDAHRQLTHERIKAFRYAHNADIDALPPPVDQDAYASEQSQLAKESRKRAQKRTLAYRTKQKKVMDGRRAHQSAAMQAEKNERLEKTLAAEKRLTEQRDVSLRNLYSHIPHKIPTRIPKISICKCGCGSQKDCHAGTTLPHGKCGASSPEKNASKKARDAATRSSRLPVGARSPRRRGNSSLPVRTATPKRLGVRANSAEVAPVVDKDCADLPPPPPPPLPRNEVDATNAENDNLPADDLSQLPLPLSLSEPHQPLSQSPSAERADASGMDCATVQAAPTPPPLPPSEVICPPSMFQSRMSLLSAISCTDGIDGAYAEAPPLCPSVEDEEAVASLTDSFLSQIKGVVLRDTKDTSPQVSQKERPLSTQESLFLAMQSKMQAMRLFVSGDAAEEPEIDDDCSDQDGDMHRSVGSDVVQSSRLTESHESAPSSRAEGDMRCANSDDEFAYESDTDTDTDTESDF